MTAIASCDTAPGAGHLASPVETVDDTGDHGEGGPAALLQTGKLPRQHEASNDERQEPDAAKREVHDPGSADSHRIRRSPNGEAQGGVGLEEAGTDEAQSEDADQQRAPGSAAVLFLAFAGISSGSGKSWTFVGFLIGVTLVWVWLSSVSAKLRAELLESR